MGNNIPLTDTDIEALLDEKHTQLHFLWKEYLNNKPSSKDSIHIMEFESSLRNAFGEIYPEVAEEMHSRIPDLLYKIQDDEGENVQARKAFLVGLYGRINYVMNQDWN
ncbi:MAG: hypothetical protein JWM20_591 [Patescibacteria group bacterium]|nr:hypothetical protein [Patescibacteria group bacterium]